MGEKKAVLLVGTPKFKNGTSEVIGDYLLSMLEQKSFTTCKFNLLKAINKPDIWEQMTGELATAELIILSAPLYVDSTPAHVILAMERIVRWREEHGFAGRPRFLAICNSGFPESHQNDIAIRIYRQFCLTAQWSWVGGFRIGGGGTITPGALKQRAQMAKNLLIGFETALPALVDGTPVPEEAFRIAETLSIPKWMYNSFGNIGMLWELARHGSLLKTFAKPDANRHHKQDDKAKQPTE